VEKKSPQYPESAKRDQNFCYTGEWRKKSPQHPGKFGQTSKKLVFPYFSLNREQKNPQDVQKPQNEFQASRVSQGTLQGPDRRSIIR
jgi:hypothetical protein